MFVWKSTYDALKDKCMSYKDDVKYWKESRDHWFNAYMESTNMCSSYLKELIKLRYEMRSIVINKQFSDDDIKKMLLLCHPDKHGGKQIAHEVTQKLLAMRGK